MPDEITIRNLGVSCHIGVPDEERRQPQTLKVSVSFRASGAKKAAVFDDLAFSTDYFAVSRRVQEIAASQPRKLIETLAEDIAQGILAEFGLKKIRVEVRKFILPDAEWVGIAIERRPSKKGRKDPRLSRPV